MAAGGKTCFDDPGLLSAADVIRLMQLVTEVALRHSCSPSEAIDRLSRAAGSNLPRRNHLGTFVDRLRRIRMRRNELVGAPLFRDPAWDMMLDLFVAHERGERLSVSSLCYGSGVPLTTALRQLNRLEVHGLVTREGDPDDLRRSCVRATPEALVAIGTLAAMVADEAAA